MSYAMSCNAAGSLAQSFAAAPGLREFAFGALVGGLIATFAIFGSNETLTASQAVEASPGILLEAPAAKRDLKDSITPSTVLGPTINNR